MSNLKTVEDSTAILDPIYAKQKEDVAKMRTSLLACTDDANMAKKAIQNISTLRVYHQIARILRYLDLMDRLEDKLYESIDRTVESARPDSPSTWMMLLSIQERLQKSMIESHKLLQPYLDLQEFSIVELTAQSGSYAQSDIILDADARDRVRESAQAALSLIGDQAR